MFCGTIIKFSYKTKIKNSIRLLKILNILIFFLDIKISHPEPILMQCFGTFTDARGCLTLFLIAAKFKSNRNGVAIERHGPTLFSLRLRKMLYSWNHLKI